MDPNTVGILVAGGGMIVLGMAMSVVALILIMSDKKTKSDH